MQAHLFGHREPKVYAERLSLESRFQGHRPTFLVSHGHPQTLTSIPAGLRHRIDRFAALAIDEVKELASRIPKSIPRERIGVYIANVYAGWSYAEAQLANLVDIGPSAVHAFQATAWFPAAAQGEMTIHYGWQGPSKTFSGSNCAVGEAFLAALMALRTQAVDVAVVGVAESCVASYLNWAAGTATRDDAIAEGAAFTALARSPLETSVPIRARMIESDALVADVGRALNDAPEWASRFGKGLNTLAKGEHDLVLPLSPSVALLTSLDNH